MHFFNFIIAIKIMYFSIIILLIRLFFFLTDFFFMQNELNITYYTSERPDHMDLNKHQ